MRSILDLTASDCRWPTTTAGRTVFACSDRAIDGKPYCGQHCAIAFRRPEPGERLAALARAARPARGGGRRAA